MAEISPDPVLTVLSRWEPTAPRLIWYGDDDERIELSGRVLSNWVIKGANLLSELDIADGDRVVVDLPAHWRLLVWALAVGAIGAELVLDVEGADGAVADEVVVSNRPERWSDAAELIAVALPSLARSWDGPLPAGAVDGAAELMGQPDVPTFENIPAVRATEVVTGADLYLDLEPSALIATAWASWLAGRTLIIATGRPAQAIEAICRQEEATLRS